MVISIILNGKSIENINVYACHKVETEQFHQNHRPLRTALVTSDFNTHHEAWYGDLA